MGWFDIGYGTGDGFKGCFRPRLGLGWFMIFDNMYEFTEKFSSPLGDGLVPDQDFFTAYEKRFSSPVGDWWFDVEQIKDTCLTKFSSPSGDGLVHFKGVFFMKNNMFSSPSGDGVVLSYDWDDDQKAKIFVPEWGWVGSPL